MTGSEHHHHDHDHDHGDQPGRKLVVAIGLLSVTLVAEVIGGLWTGSLALLADAGHVFMDLFALGISLLAVRLSRLPATSTKTYGWHRAEILAALANGTLLVLLALGLFRAAYDRIHEPSEILSMPMLVVAVIGLVMNLIIARSLHVHDQRDLNLKSAYLHVLGDAGASVAVIVAAIVIRVTGWTPIDAIISSGIGILIFVGAVRLLVRASHVLLEEVPMGISLETVAGAIRDVEGVKGVHDLHIWSVCSHIINMSCHIQIDSRGPEHHDRTVKAVATMLWRRFCIMHPTIQVEYEACSDAVVTQDMHHPDWKRNRDHAH